MGETYAGLSSKSKEDFGHGEAEFVPYMNVFTNPIADVAMTEAIEIDDRQAKVKNGDVLFTTSSETPEEVGMSSVWLKNGSNTYLNSFCFGFRASESINSYYLAYMLRSSGVRRKIVFLAQGISRYNISKKKMMEIKVPMPISAEQRQLGEIFRQLDNLITLHQRKQKCKFLSFPTSKAGLFLANSWEQREFNSIAKRITEMTDTEDLPRVEYEDIVSGQGTLNKDINKKKSCKTGILFDNGDVLFGKLRPYLKNWLFATFMGIAVGDFWVLRANNADGLYIYTLLQIDAFQDIANQSTGTKMPRADWSLVSKQRFLTPTVVPEQRKIGEFFKQLDNLITLHQCKDFALDTNKAFQQRCLLSIKSANAWEQRKAKTLFISYAEKGYPELPVLSATQDKGMVYRDDTGKNIFHDKNNEISYKRVQPGQFVIHLRSFQGGFAHSNILGITSPAYTIFGFKDDEKQCDLYWKYVFCSSEFVKRLETVTYGIRDGRSISYDEFLTMKFIVPKYEEQVQIASILIEIDNLITLHQRQLEKLKNIKAALLEKMFV